MYPKPQLAYLHNNTLPRGTPLNPLFGKNISHMVGLSKYMMEINIVGRGLNSDFIEEELRFPRIHLPIRHSSHRIGRVSFHN